MSRDVEVPVGVSDNAAAQGEHLPECLPIIDGVCICKRLRACEARVREEFDQQALFADAKAWGYRLGRAAGLDAAAEVVAALESFDARPAGDMEYQPVIYQDNALGDIATLRATP